MEFGLPCFPGSYLIRFPGLCLEVSHKNTTDTMSFCCFSFLIISLGDFVPPREGGSADTEVSRRPPPCSWEPPCFLAQR